MKSEFEIKNKTVLVYKYPIIVQVSPKIFTF